MSGASKFAVWLRPLEARLGLLLLVLCLMPFVVGGRYELQIANMILVYIVIAMGLNITLGYSGQISVAQSALAAVGAYVSALFVMRLDWPFLAAAAAGIGAATVIGIIIGLLTYRVRTHYVLLVTFGFHIIILVFIRNLTELTGGPMGLYPIPAISLWGWSLTSQTAHFYLFLFVAALLLFLAERIRHSRLGLAMFALKNNEQGARAVGISPLYHRTMAMALGALYAGVGGVMFAFLIKFLGPESFDLHSALLYVLIVVLAGLGSNWGVVITAILLTVLSEQLKIFAESWVLIYGLLIILVVILLPGGVSALLTRLKEQFFGGPAASDRPSTDQTTLAGRDAP